MARRWNSVFTVNDQNPVPHLHPIPVQEPWCGARGKLCKVREAGCGVSCPLTELAGLRDLFLTLVSQARLSALARRPIPVQ